MKKICKSQNQILSKVVLMFFFLQLLNLSLKILVGWYIKRDQIISFQSVQLQENEEKTLFFLLPFFFFFKGVFSVKQIQKTWDSEEDLFKCSLTVRQFIFLVLTLGSEEGLQSRVCEVTVKTAFKKSPNSFRGRNARVGGMDYTAIVPPHQYHCCSRPPS